LTGEEHLKRNPVKKVKGKHGEPLHWDGLASLFLLLTRDYPATMTATDRAWAAALAKS
jgi:hypothetical protein